MDEPAGALRTYGDYLGCAPPATYRLVCARFARRLEHFGNMNLLEDCGQQLAAVNMLESQFAFGSGYKRG